MTSIRATLLGRLIVGLALFASCAPTASVSVFDRDYIGPRDTIAVVVDDASPNTLERQAWAQVNSAFASHRFVRSRFVMVERQRIDAWLDVVTRRDATCREMQDSWF